MNKKITTIGIIALVLISAFFVGCSSTNDVTTQPPTTQTAPTTDSATVPSTQSSELTIVTQDDTEIGEMI